MILVVAVFVSLLVALLRGGRLVRLGDLRIAHAWLALAAVFLQYPLVYNLVGEWSIAGLPVATVMMAASYLLLCCLVWHNRRLPGIRLVGLGMLANLAVIMLNGGWMPITPEALERLGHMSWVTPAGSTAKVWGAKNVMRPRADTRLWWLSDIFVLTAPFPVPCAFSIGDVLVALGIFWLLQQTLLGRGYSATSRTATEH